MFYLSRRQTRTAVSAAAGAAVYLAASELGKDKLKMTGLFVLASASMAGMVTAQASAKAYNAHRRIDALVPTVAGKYDKSGGTISGSVTVTGDHTIQGTMFGTGGSIAVGDSLVSNTGATFQAPVTVHDNVNLDGNISMPTGHINGVGGLTRLSTPVTDSNFSQENSTENTNRSRVNAIMDGL